MRSALLLPLLLLQAACWSPRYFTPREHVNGTGPKGHAAAVYSVAGADAAQPPGGEVRMWSQGARAHYDANQDEVVQLHIGFELENTGAEPLQLDLAGMRCEEVMVGGLLLPPFAPLRVEGDGYAPPGSTARVDVTFQPAAEAPRDIEGFAIRFTVLAGERRALSQVTPFGPRVQQSTGSAYYGSGFGSPWGWGWGYSRWR